MDTTVYKPAILLIWLPQLDRVAFRIGKAGETAVGIGIGIDLDLEGARVTRMDRDEVAFEVGGGAASIRLDTGSGRIRIRD